MTAQEQLATFTLARIPTLDVAVMGALELFNQITLPASFNFYYQRPLVLASGNALVTAQIIFAQTDAIFADESNFKTALSREGYDAVIILSASGGKHATLMSAEASAGKVPVHLITSTEAAPAAAGLPLDQAHVFPKNREPYTYNTSTYLGPILVHTGESPVAIAAHLEHVVKPRLLRTFSDFKAFTFIIPTQFSCLRGMIRTKFDELFGPQLVGRCFTTEEIKHAKTVVQSGEELFIALGTENNHYGLAKNRLSVPLLEGGGYGSAMTAAYYLIGHIQKAHPPYFAQNIENYCRQASAVFGYTIQPIVE